MERWIGWFMLAWIVVFPTPLLGALWYFTLTAPWHGTPWGLCVFLYVFTGAATFLTGALAWMLVEDLREGG